VGVEIEPRFAAMGGGCNCTGISKADWVQFYGRWDRVAYQDNRCFCPACLDRVSGVEGEAQVILSEASISRRRRIEILLKRRKERLDAGDLSPEQIKLLKRRTPFPIVTVGDTNLYAVSVLNIATAAATSSLASVLLATITAKRGW
jgi:hypothetical protein